MTEVVDVDKELKEIDPTEFEYPMVDEVPEGWPGLKAIGGKTWYQRALKTEQLTGHPVLPSKYTYDENWNVVINPNYRPNVECEDCEEGDGSQDL